MSEMELSPVKVLSKPQRRVLGVLIEKGITTPEYYPMTPKGVTAGCNQKNNRSPLSDYSEDDVLKWLEELRELGLVAVVHTESGRTERYRHYVRKRFPFNEAQLAIITELWLRGRQSLGDLRVRASRMHAIDSLDQLRAELSSLAAQGFLQANGPLTGRGVDVDHTFYKPTENMALVNLASSEEDSVEIEEQSGVFRKSESVPLRSEFAVDHREFSNSSSVPQMRLLEDAVAVLKEENAALRDRVRATEQALSQLADSVQALRRELGCS